MLLHRRLRWLIPVLLMSASSIGVLMMRGHATARPLAPPATQDDLAAFEQLRSALQGMGSIHVRSSVMISVTKPTSVATGRALYEYWEDGAKYRILSDTDSSLGLMKGASVAFDGTRFTYYDPVQSILSYSAADTRNNPSALPNPVFLPFDFLERGTQDGCAGCRLRLTDLADESRWQQSMSSFRLGNDGTLETERTTAVTGKVIRHRIWTSGGSKRRVTKIVREDEPSGMVATIEVNAHDPNTGLPRQVTATIATADGKSTLQAWFVIETIEPVAAGSEAVFTIDSTGVETVWDSDSDTFLRTRGWNRPVSLTELVDLCRARKAQK